MTDNPTPAQPDLDQAPGWVVLDPGGNVVDSGPVTFAEAAAQVGETEQTDDAEGAH